MIRRPPRSTLSSSSAASDVYKRQARYDAEIDGGAQNKAVGRGNLCQDGPEIILDGALAITLAAPGLAGKTTDAAFKIEIIQMHQFGLRPLGRRPFQGFFQ